MIALLLLFTGHDNNDDVIDPELSSLSLNRWNALELLL